MDDTNKLVALLTSKNKQLEQDIKDVILDKDPTSNVDKKHIDFVKKEISSISAPGKKLIINILKLNKDQDYLSDRDKEKLFDQLIGNLSLNKDLKIFNRLASFFLSADSEKINLLNNIFKFTYKSRYFTKADRIIKKLSRNLEILERDGEILDKEKITLSEEGMLMDTDKADDIVQDELIIQLNLQDSFKNVKKLNEYATKINDLENKLEIKLFDSWSIKSGDIIVSPIIKENSLSNRSVQDFMEKIKKKITTNSHAAVVLKDKSNLVNYIHQSKMQFENLNKIIVNSLTAINNIFNFVEDRGLKDKLDFDNLNQKVKEIDNDIMLQFVQLKSEIFALESNNDLKIENNFKKMEKSIISSLDNIIDNIDNIKEVFNKIHEALYEDHIKDEEYDLVKEYIDNYYLLNGSKDDFDKIIDIVIKIVDISANSKTISHVYNEYQKDYFDLSDLLKYDAYRINPIKLISDKNQGILKNKLGADWQNQVKKIFQDEAKAIHQESYNIMNNTNRMMNAGFASILGGVANSKNDKRVADDINVKKGFIGSILKAFLDIPVGKEGHKDKGEIDPAKFQKLRNALLNGVNSVQGEDLNRLFDNAEYKEKTHSDQMICSEFAVKTTLAALYSLNEKLEEMTGQKNLVKSPISKKEILSRVHPGRLIKLLDKAGCLEEVNNPVRDKLFSSDKKHLKKDTEIIADKTKIIYKKMRNLIKKTDFNIENFVTEGKKIMKSYIESFDNNKTEAEQDQFLNKQLNELFKRCNIRITENPLIHFFRKILEFCGIKTHKAKLIIDQTISESQGQNESRSR